MTVILGACFLKTILDHLIHIQDPDLEDLGQDLWGRLQLNGLVDYRPSGFD
jgi:hypothetical protein